MKVNVAVTIDNELLKWVESKIKNRKFANRSHGFEYCIKFTQNNNNIK